ncbi:uncharacterized protein LOC115887156 [Sitophilus oryzae]|uniref:Uncharacterized protein LOC115887156 n=1 Tax=Sitophilus oryzae TaxID=7048 RepID=A0A6J2YHJ1_SITOR|nr:uncharacterized protein LOC115887156 [Sitophilus oryzae]
MSMGGYLDTEALLTDLHKWVSAETLRKKNIEKYDLKVYGVDDKVDNYGSDIVFVDITAENFDGEKRSYSLVVKYGQMMNELRDKLPIRDAFEREIDVYTKLVLAFHTLQQEKRLPIFNSIPKCFLSKFTPTEEVIILENLRQLGYTVYKKQTGMDVLHMKLVLKAYAHWHALSFALKDQKKEEFQEITETWIKNPMKAFVGGVSGKLINASQKQVFEILRNEDKEDLLEKYTRKIGKKNFVEILMNLLSNEDAQSVVLHGDCWSSNFLFQYDDGDTEQQICKKVALVDFQMSSVNSPVFDLSYFIYSVADKDGLTHFEELLNYYYDHFSNYLIELGSDPGVIFSYSDLLRHWRQYSIYGAVLSPMILMLVLNDKTLDFLLDNDNFYDISKDTVKKNEYKERIIAIAQHFLNHFG